MKRTLEIAEAIKKADAYFEENLNLSGNDNHWEETAKAAAAQASTPSLKIGFRWGIYPFVGPEFFHKRK